MKWKSEIRWVVRAPWIVVLLGVAGAIDGLLTNRYQWYLGGGAMAAAGGFLLRLTKRGKFGGTGLPTIEGDLLTPEDDEDS